MQPAHESLCNDVKHIHQMLCAIMSLHFKHHWISWFLRAKNFMFFVTINYIASKLMLYPIDINGDKVLPTMLIWYGTHPLCQAWFLSYSHHWWKWTGTFVSQLLVSYHLLSLVCVSICTIYTIIVLPTLNHLHPLYKMLFKNGLDTFPHMLNLDWCYVMSVRVLARTLGDGFTLFG